MNKHRPILMSAPMIRAYLEGRKNQTRRVIKYFDGSTAARDPDSIGHWKFAEGKWWAYAKDAGSSALPVFGCKCPYGDADCGDGLWVKENWRTHVQYDSLAPNALPFAHDVIVSPYLHYEADGPSREIHGRIRPSIHMPEWATRADLDVVNVRVERVQDISEEDAKAEAATALPLWRMWHVFTENGSYSIGTGNPEPVDGETDCLGRNILAHCIQTVSEAETHREAFRKLWDSINAKRGFSWGKNPWVFAISFVKYEAKE